MYLRNAIKSRHRPSWGLTLIVRADEDEDYSDVQNDRTTCILGARASPPACGDWGDTGVTCDIAVGVPAHMRRLRADED